MSEIKEIVMERVLEFTPRVFEDSRGLFFESYREDWLINEGIKTHWVQENQSFSQKGTIRGLHFQSSPFGQAKLARVVKGSVLDVVVDLRKESPGFGKSFTTILDTKKNNLIYVPEGFAHGFSVLEDAIFLYKCSASYNKESEDGILWNDPKLAIDWQVKDPIISEKDEQWLGIENFIEKYKGGL